MKTKFIHQFFILLIFSLCVYFCGFAIWTSRTPFIETKATFKTSDNFDPVWHVTYTCVGEDGATLNYHPDSVANGTTVTINTSDCQNWSFELNNFNATEQTGGGTITYKYFEVCSSVQINWDAMSSMTGWGVRDNPYYARSFELGTAPLPVWQIVLQSSGNCIVTCYLMDESGNPHLLGSFECTPP